MLDESSLEHSKKCVPVVVLNDSSAKLGESIGVLQQAGESVVIQEG